MEEDCPAPSTKRRTRCFGDEFRYGRDIDNWEEFKSTWRSVPFHAQLNDFTREELNTFWSVHLDALLAQS